MRKFYGRYVDLFKQYVRMLNEIYNDNPQPIRLFTKSWPYCWTRSFTELCCFHRSFATDVACRQGVLTPLDTWSRPISDFAYVIIFMTNPFPELVLIFSDYALRKFISTFSILLPKHILCWTFETYFASLKHGDCNFKINIESGTDLRTFAAPRIDYTCIV